MIDGQILLETYLQDIDNNSSNNLISSKNSQIAAMERQVESLMIQHMSYDDACDKVGYHPEEDIAPVVEAGYEASNISVDLRDRAMNLKSTLGYLATFSRLDGFKKQCDKNYNHVRSKHDESYISDKLKRRKVSLELAKSAFYVAFGFDAMPDDGFIDEKFDYEFREFKNEFTGTNGAKQRNKLKSGLSLQKKKKGVLLKNLDVIDVE